MSYLRYQLRALAQSFASGVLAALRGASIEHPVAETGGLAEGSRRSGCDRRAAAGTTYFAA
jgi:hypothetical protein